MNSNRNVYYFILAFAAVCTVVIGYKSFASSFTYDESSTFLYGVQGPFKDIFRFKYVSANNHLLNTLFSKLLATFFGNSELILRLPNVLSLFLYVFYCYKLLSSMDRFSILTGVIIMVANPYLLDFFGLSRGYGLNIAFLVGSMYYLLRYLQDRQMNALLCTQIMGILALFSNLTSIYYYSSMLIILGVSMLTKARCDLRKVRREIMLVLFIQLLLAYPLFSILSQLLDTNALYYGGKVGIFTDTVGSLVSHSLYDAQYAPSSFEMIKVIMMALFLLMILLSALFQFFPRARENSELLVFPTVLLVLILIQIEINNVLLGVLFPIDRTALFLLPIFLCGVISLIKSAIIFMGKPGRLVLFALSATLIIHTVLSWSWDSYYNWRYDSRTKQAYSLLMDQIDSTQKVLMSSGWQYRITLDYYFIRGSDHKKFPNLNILRAGDVPDSVFKEADYFYLGNEDIDLVEEYNLSVIRNFGTSDTFFAKKKDLSSSHRQADH